MIWRCLGDCHGFASSHKFLLFLIRYVPRFMFVRVKYIYFNSQIMAAGVPAISTYDLLKEKNRTRNTCRKTSCRQSLECCGCHLNVARCCLRGACGACSSSGLIDSGHVSSNVFDLQRSEEMSDVPAAALLAAAAVASESDLGVGTDAVGSRSGLRNSSGSNSPSPINDSELSALMATLMCR